MIDIKKAEQEMLDKRKASFNAFMAQPSVRMMMSLIPPTEKPEILEALLASTFETGFSAGVSTTSILFMQQAIDRHLKG